MTSDRSLKPYHAPPGWFLSHWRGDTSLGISYWLNGLLLGSLLPALVLIGYSLVNPLRHSRSSHDLYQRGDHGHPIG